MENASKALLIAGAILLAILLISLGIMVYNNAKGTISDSNLDTEKAQAFNTKISQYCGTRKSGTTMNSLVDAIAASNGAQNGKPTQHLITLTVSGQGATSTGTFGSATTSNYPSFDSSHTYTATYSTDAHGYVNAVTIAGPTS